MNPNIVHCAQCTSKLVVDKSFPSVEFRDGRMVTAYVCSIECLVKRVLHVYKTATEEADRLENGR